jgi:uncharacterized cupredoxin-like copper-binding protein
MHTAALHLAPILGAEKSKVPFYIAGGLLVAWALIVSFGLGMRRPDFPSTLGGQRAVMATTAVLVLATVSMAVVTSGGGATSAAAAHPTPVIHVEGSAGATQTTATSGATTLLALQANPQGQLSYNTKQLAAHAGTVTIVMANMAPLEHNVTVAEGSKVLGATPTFAGGTRRLTLNLKPGRYTFYCSVPGHRQAGMEGTLSIS